MRSQSDVLKEWLELLRDQYSVPRAPFEISKSLGIELIVGNSENLSEFDMPAREVIARAQPRSGLFVGGPTPTIFINQRQPRKPGTLTPRERFTWAHELAHYVLWRSTGNVSGTSYWRSERLCNWFAGEFLVPVASLAAVVGSPSRTWFGSVADVQTKFQVSWDVAAGCMTAYSAGKVVFLRGRVLKPAGSHWQVAFTSTSTRHYCGDIMGDVVVRDFLFVEQCRLAHGPRPKILKLERDIGKIPASGSYALAWRRGDQLDLMIRTKGLKPRGDLT